MSGGRFEGGDGKGGLKAVLRRGIVGDDIVVAPVELAFVRPPLLCYSQRRAQPVLVESITTQRLAVMYGAIMP